MEFNYINKPNYSQCGKPVILGQYLAWQLTSSQLTRQRFLRQFLVKFEAFTCIRSNPGNFDAAAVISTLKRSNLIWTHLFFLSCLLIVSQTFWERKKVINNFDNPKRRGWSSTKYFRSAAINVGIFGIWWNLRQVVGLNFGRCNLAQQLIQTFHPGITVIGVEAT